MFSRTLGNTNLKVTPIGLGLAALGRPGYINLGHADDLNQSYQVQSMEEHTHAMLDFAWEKGIRYFDAARSYGKAEEFLGSWLCSKELKFDEASVGSKWGYTYTANWQVEAEKHEVKEHSLAVLQKQWNETKTNLGDYLDLYQIHSATLESGVLENKEVLEELAKLKESGILIGLTLSGAKQAITLEKALTIIVDGRLLFDVVQATWNILEPSVGDALSHAHQEGMGVIIKESVANGRLTEKNVEPDFKDKFKILQELAAEHQVTIDGLALAMVVRNPWVDVVLSGAATIAQLESNLRALALNIDDSSAEQLLRSVKERPEVYWKIRKQLQWN